MYEIFSGFYSSTETSRIIRLGTRNYTLRIAAASQEHVLICITRKVTRPESDMFFFFGIEIDLVVVWVVEIDVISVWGTGVDLISVYGSELTWFRVGVENYL